MACRHSPNDDCPLCQATLEADEAKTIERGQTAEGEAPLAPGSLIGRYQVLEVLGQGGMGVVYSAHDPQLQRVVAIKMLRSVRKEHSDTAQARLLREAQAMAQLSHPNVVPVYDVGTFQDTVFLAMELVQGATLDHWIKIKARPWREVLSLFIEAGRGLEAAHAKGLVHRDFKPPNVLVGNDGRTRVTDFGLARQHVDSAEGAALGGTPSPGISSEPLTQAGMIMGTPGYMAPEQYSGVETSPATDQFAFCASLYWALYEQRAFTASSIAEMEIVTSRGVVPPPPPGTAVPAWVHRIVVKGLSVRPEDRHASMGALLLALEDDPVVRRWRRLQVAAVSLLVVAAVGGSWWSSFRRARTCQGADQLLTQVWNDELKADGHARFVSTKLPFAESSWTLASASIDTWANAWVRARTEACEATRVRGENTERQLLLRFECLDQRLHELGALSAAFTTADEALVASSATSAADLSSIAPCLNVKQLEDRRAPPPEKAQIARELSLQLAEGRALLLTGKNTEARAKLAVIASTAEQHRLVVVESEAHEALLEAEIEARDFAKAREHGKRAVQAAELAADDVGAARVLSRMVSLVGWRQSRAEEARTWAALASSMVERTGGDAQIEARIEEGLGDTEWREGNRIESLAAYRRSLARWAVAKGQSSLEVARVHSSIGWVLTEQGELDGARVEIEASRKLREALFGEGHPALVDTWNELSHLALQRRDYDEELRCAERALRLAEVATPRRALQAKVAYASALIASGHIDDAERVLRETQATVAEFERTQPVRRYFTHTWIQMLVKQGRSPEALKMAKELMAQDEQVLGPQHPEVAATVGVLADAALSLERWQEAIDGFERYLSIKAALGGRDTPHLGEVLLDSARAHLALGKVAEAAPRAERALVVLSEDPDPLFRAEARTVVAEVLARAHQDPSRARKLVDTARVDAEASGDKKAIAHVARVSALLDGH